MHLDNELGGFMATKHLLEHGHRRVAHITGPLWHFDSRARLAGYRRALEEARVPFNEQLVVEGDFQEDGALSRPPPSSCCAHRRTKAASLRSSPQTTRPLPGRSAYYVNGVCGCPPTFR